MNVYYAMSSIIQNTTKPQPIRIHVRRSQCLVAEGHYCARVFCCIFLLIDRLLHNKGTHGWCCTIDNGGSLIYLSFNQTYANKLLFFFVQPRIFDVFFKVIYKQNLLLEHYLGRIINISQLECEIRYKTNLVH